MGLKLDRRWVVKNRSKTLHRILRLQEFATNLDDKSSLWSSHNILVGTIFSLWRAVILIGLDRDFAGEIAHGKRLLEILIDTNAVAFPQDRETAHWTAGYYVNNAIFRLYALTKMVSTSANLANDTKSELETNCNPNAIDQILASGTDDLVPIWMDALKWYDLVFRDLKAARSAQDQ
jgi:hypothetical protein